MSLAILRASILRSDDPGRPMTATTSHAPTVFPEDA
jgi:hypothetical protein